MREIFDQTKTLETKIEDKEQQLDELIEKVQE